MKIIQSPSGLYPWLLCSQTFLVFYIIILVNSWRKTQKWSRLDIMYCVLLLKLFANLQPWFTTKKYVNEDYWSVFWSSHISEKSSIDDSKLHFLILHISNNSVRILPPPPPPTHTLFDPFWILLGSLESLLDLFGSLRSYHNLPITTNYLVHLLTKQRINDLTDSEGRLEESCRSSADQSEVKGGQTIRRGMILKCCYYCL